MTWACKNNDGGGRKPRQSYFFENADIHHMPHVQSILKFFLNQDRPKIQNILQDINQKKGNISKNWVHLCYT